ncbi:sulfurtransferase [Nocardioides terrisoli]|uniref:sulfurtransferase n=1 Tax=Nocardioides terrisoli TaxID=3388267 RepID=UPI00287B7F45|nr:sulfurtransferase [Nocardioides marmorisolisilvae]
MTISGSGPLITVVELRGRLEEVTVLDIRYRMGGPGGLEVFTQGHVPGATYVDLDLDLAGPPAAEGAGGGRHPLPEPFRFVNAMRAAGVSNARPVVVYDDWQGRAAGRAWWLLRHYGHPDVRVLDGGWTAWQQDGGPVETETRVAEEGDFAGAPGHLPTLDAGAVADFSGTVVDARDPARYRGDTEPVDPVAGHIPGAVNVPTGANLRDDGTFRPAEELRGLYAEAVARAGQDPGGRVATYCGSGVTATHDLLALAAAGIEGVLYPGSWSDWVSDPDRPVATGEPGPER